MAKIGFVVLAVVLGCGLEPNTDLGLHVEASVYPRLVSIADTAATLYIRVVVTNPTDRDIVVVTGGPPYTITSDPADSRGLTQSFRLASADEPLHAGPSVDSWGEPVDTIRARRGEYTENIVRLSPLSLGTCS